MKKLLPLLLCYTLTQTQCFAISGGPNYGNGGVDVVGTYSGIIQGVTETDPTNESVPAIPGDPVQGGTGNPTTTSSNALGLFDLIVPGTTAAQGGFLLFADGIVFPGTISASVDPDSDRLAGILEGGFTVTTSTTGTGTNVVNNSVAATAVGAINAKINPPGSRSLTAGRLTGTATLDVDFGQINDDFSPVVNREITFTVTGFKSTSSTSTLSTIGTATSSTSTGNQTSG